MGKLQIHSPLLSHTSPPQKNAAVDTGETLFVGFEGDNLCLQGVGLGGQLDDTNCLPSQSLVDMMVRLKIP